MSGYTFLANTEGVRESISRLGIRVVLASSVALFILIFVAVLQKNKSKQLQSLLFFLITCVVIASAITLLGSNIYLRSKSESEGRVQRRADFEIWACDRQLELRNPTGFLSTRIGTTTLYERDDQRIHIDGMIIDKSADASLGGFFNAVGGSISKDLINVPLEADLFENHIDGDVLGDTNIDGFISTDVLGDKSLIAVTGQKCDGEKAEIQAFVYKFNESNNTYSQTKLSDPSDFEIGDNSSSNLNDCIIIEFGAKKEKTTKLCSSYGNRDEMRCKEFGVPEKEISQCNLREVTTGGNQ